MTALHLPHHLHHHHLILQTTIIQTLEMIQVIHLVIPAYQVMTVAAKTRNPRKEQRSTNQNQRQPKDTDITLHYSINYAEQQKTTD